MMNKQLRPVQMAEPVVFAKAFALGFATAQVFELARRTGLGVSSWLDQVPSWLPALLVAVGLTITVAYALVRNAHEVAVRLIRSRRLDLLAALAIGGWTSALASPVLAELHGHVTRVTMPVAPALLAALFLLLLSPLFRPRRQAASSSANLPDFVDDEAIQHEDDDHLDIAPRAKEFATAVLDGGMRDGMVFGVDGPWGIGKTSFLNLAHKQWAAAAGNQVIVFRFEPLRYAGEPDLAQRFMREMSSTIQKHVFAPEFQPAASRYSRMLRGKADLSFFGLKFSLDPADSTMDDVLEDIDTVLRRSHRRLIIVIDDLDRLNADMVNNVLFLVRRTLRLAQVTYVLCYDTNHLLSGKEDGERARQFLEKFVNATFSLFVDAESLGMFLSRDWHEVQQETPSSSSVLDYRLSTVVGALRAALTGPHASRYLALVGNLRQAKRFINALRTLKLVHVNLAKTDFHPADLLNLLLLHQHYPAVFRRIHLEEAGGRHGMFSSPREVRDGWAPSIAFEAYKKEAAEPAAFLLGQLFGPESEPSANTGEFNFHIRARHNDKGSRNLQQFLDFIVHFVVPAPTDTHVLYRQSVDSALLPGASIRQVLQKPEFSLQAGEQSHERFWTALTDRVLDYHKSQEAVDVLASYVEVYSLIAPMGGNMRGNCAYWLAMILDRASWRRTEKASDVVSENRSLELAIHEQIFGHPGEHDGGIVARLCASQRGALRWYDILMLRLTCSPDRRGELHRLYKALLLDAPADDDDGVQSAAQPQHAMRRLSQDVFGWFQCAHIESRTNYLDEIDALPEKALLGTAELFFRRQSQLDITRLPLQQRVAAARNSAKFFVLYQLLNASPPSNLGVGCGLWALRCQRQHG